MQIINDPKLDFKDVLIMPKVSYIGSRAEVDILRRFEYIAMDGSVQVLEGIPIIASNMDGVGTPSMSKALADGHGCYTALTKDTPIEKWDDLDPNYTIFSAGIGVNELKRLWEFQDKYPLARLVCLDVANGYNMEFVEFVKKVRETSRADTFIIAGNVVTPAQTEALIMAGANAVKVGIGSGSVCTTRKVTGVGYPQLSAIIECADAAHGLHGFVVADGGCQTPGDVCKAFAAGADFVMLGGMLAGHDESEVCGPTPILDGVPFYGSSSKTAQEKNGRELAEYRSSEGKRVTVKYRGKVTNTISHICGGLRSCCTYVGAATLKELSKRTTFVRVYNGSQYNTVFGDSNEVS